jgi:phosphatidylinositol glycan class S
MTLCSILCCLYRRHPGSLSVSLTHTVSVHYILSDWVTGAISGSPTNQNTFLLPQWGGIFILNRDSQDAIMTHLTAADLVPVFSAFSNQLTALLGVPSLPRGVRSEISQLSDWQLDALLRHRTSENILSSQQTLYSIVKLVDQIGAMPVDQKVRGDVHNALAALEEVYIQFWFTLSTP